MLLIHQPFLLLKLLIAGIEAVWRLKEFYIRSDAFCSERPLRQRLDVLWPERVLTSGSVRVSDEETEGR